MTLHPNPRRKRDERSKIRYARRHERHVIKRLLATISKGL